MNEKSKHILSQQTIRCGFPISFGNLRRSCCGLSRRNSLFTGVGRDVESRHVESAYRCECAKWSVRCRKWHRLKDRCNASLNTQGNIKFAATKVVPVRVHAEKSTIAWVTPSLPTPVDSESMNAIAVTGSAHQSQFKMSSGNFLPIESGDFPTVLRPGAAEGATTPQRPAYQVYPAI